MRLIEVYFYVPPLEFDEELGINGTKFAGMRGWATGAAGSGPQLKSLV
jgi:hypothetical protein